ncbi:glutathione peroxidase [Thioclava sp. FTW29]|uniref:Glutathione peroxidase n=1 Tax=Thioclava litoralis TaxID=3076557 RepID=A0ABZ1E3B9_9RHOB|nr:glutathione peroxidase [Thioclava sp. FTW29]
MRKVVYGVIGLFMLIGFALSATGAAVSASSRSPMPDVTFQGIEGQNFRLADWSDKVVLVVNTASRCGYAGQFEEMQELLDRYADQGFTVLAVPSDDFRQELPTNEEVRRYCVMAFGIEDMPMAQITAITGTKAHPFYAWLRDRYHFEPDWNFNKVLLGRGGEVLRTYRASDAPMSEAMRRDIETALKG